MPGDTLQIQYDELGSIAQQFVAQSEIIAQIHRQIAQESEHLRPDWTGASADQFFGEMQSSIMPALVRLHAAMASGATTTSSVMGLLQNAEQDASHLFNGDYSASGAGGAGGAEETGAPGAPGSPLDNAMASIADLVAASAKQATSGGARTQLKTIIDGAGNNSAEAISFVDRLSPEAQQSIWSDRELMHAVRADMTTGQYLDFLVAARINESGSVQHTTAATADSAIRQHLGQYLGANADGQHHISGQVGILQDEDWDIAGSERYGNDLWHSTKRDALNGFVDTEGRVWIHADRGNPTTMLHEAVHKYSNDAMIEVSQPLNEGVTEYFARSTAQSLGLPDRTNYQGNYTYVKSLTSLVGEDTVADAFFNGNMDGLRKAYVKTGHSDADWNTMIEHTQQNAWADAQRFATPTAD